MGLTLREQIGRRLTIAEMDGNFLYLQDISGNSKYISLTQPEAIDLIIAGSVSQGATYVIMDANTALYGSGSDFTYGLTGTNIILHGLDSTHFSTNGYGQFYNPIYASYSMWDGNATYSVDDKVIFGGQVWVNTTGNTGTASNQGQYDIGSFISLDPEDWDVQPYTDTSLYNCVWDEIEYDLQNDFITSRYEAFGNNLVRNGSKTFWFNCEINPIQSFRWGSYNEWGPTVQDCTILDSYFGCLNMINGDINNVELTNFSWIFNMTLTNFGYISCLKLSNNSGINTFTLDDSASLSNITLDNESTFNNFTINSQGYMQFISLTNNCNIYYFTLSGRTNLSYVTLTNDSYMYDFVLYDEGTSMQHLNLSNRASFESFDLSNGNITDVTMANDSGINDFGIGGGSIIKITLENGSYISNFTFDNTGCFMEWVDMSGTCNMRNFHLYSGSYIEEIDMSNDCVIENFDLHNISYFSCVAMSGDSRMNHVYLYENSYFETISIKNESGISGVYLCDESGSGCYITDVEITNSSFLWDYDDLIYLNDGGYLAGIKIDNFSYISAIIIYGYFFGPYMENIIVSNGSSISHIYLNGQNHQTSIYNLSIVNSGFRYIEMYDSYMQYLNITNGVMDSLHLFDRSYITDVEIHDGAISYWNMVADAGDHIYLGNSNIQGVKIEQSVLSGYISMTNSSFIHNIHLSNFSTFVGGYNQYGDATSDQEFYYKISLNDSGINDMILNNNSYFGYGSIDLTSSYLNNITLNNNSKIAGFIYASYSTIKSFSLDNNSFFGRSYHETQNYNTGSIQLYSSTMSYFNMTNNAVVDGIIRLENSSITDVSLSGIPDSDDGQSLGSSYFYDFDNETGIIFGYGIGMYDSFLQGIDVKNGSYFTGLSNPIILESGSYIQSLKLDNSSIINGIFIATSSYMKDIEVLSGSVIYNISIDTYSQITQLSVTNYSIFGNYINLTNGSYMTFIEIDNNSAVFGAGFGDYDINLYNNSYMQNISVLNYSNMTGFTFDGTGSGGSSFNNITLNNGSSMYNIELNNNSYLRTIDIDNGSNIDGVHLCDDSGSNASLYNIKLNNDSHISNDSGALFLEDNGYIGNVDMNNGCWISGPLYLYVDSYINYIKMENNCSFGYNFTLVFGSYITNISLNNASYITGYILMLGSAFDYINIVNNSWIEGHSEFYGSYLYNIELINYSKMYDEILTNSAIGQLSINNNSKMYGNTMDGYSAIEYTTINNHSNVYNNNILNSSVFEYLTLNNSTYLFNNTLDSSGIEWLHTDDCSIDNNNFYNDSGIYDSTISDSVIQNIYMTFSSYIADTQMSNSTILDINMYDSAMRDNFMKNSSIYTISMTNSGINDNQLFDSHIYNNVLVGTQIDNSLLSAYSAIYGSSLIGSNINICQLYSGNIHHQTMDSATIQGVLLRSSMFDSNTFYSGGGIQNSEFINNSTLSSCFFSAYIQNSSLNSSNLNTTIIVDGYGIEFLYMRDSNFQGYNGTSSWIVNLDMLGSSFNFGGGNYVIPTYTNANTNTIKYQFQVSFDGTTGYGLTGAVNIPFVLIPWENTGENTGWYIERVIVDNNTGNSLSIADTPYLNIGTNISSNSGLNNTKGLVTSLINKITYSDISNGGADGTKTNAIGNLTMDIEGGSITAGKILVEVTLKNTNYGHNND